ncbi:hypothetical protein EYF80_038878 [Liparis tanakae]|uniref:Uncharacterized protein n=1 Tax=Liparis tanakae TaxID=230148 RepID=A0A4Z2GCU4_9TELE|nr:hypothetical protein EYF80_038878 [Liparis tanakae]
MQEGCRIRGDATRPHSSGLQVQEGQMNTSKQGKADVHPRRSNRTPRPEVSELLPDEARLLSVRLHHRRVQDDRCVTSVAGEAGYCPTQGLSDAHPTVTTEHRHAFQLQARRRFLVRKAGHDADHPLFDFGHPKARVLLLQTTNCLAPARRRVTARMGRRKDLELVMRAQNTHMSTIWVGGCFRMCMKEEGTCSLIPMVKISFTASSSASRYLRI